MIASTNLQRDFKRTYLLQKSAYTNFMIVSTNLQSYKSTYLSHKSAYIKYCVQNTCHTNLHTSNIVSKIMFNVVDVFVHPTTKKIVKTVNTYILIQQGIEIGIGRK